MMRARILGKLSGVEAKLLLREPMTLVFTFGFPLLVLFVLSEVFGTEVVVDEETGETVFRGVPAAEYYLPAYIALVTATIGVLAIPVHLAGYRERGVLRRFRASGLPVWAVVGSQVLVGIGIAAVSGVLLVIASALAYGTGAPERPVGALAAFLLVGAAFGAFGSLLGALLPTARAAQGAGLLLFFVMMFVCGAGPPPEVLTPVLRRVADGLPLTYGIRALQDPWFGFAWSTRALLVMIGVGALSALLAARLLRE